MGHYLEKYDIWSSYKVESEGVVIAYTSVYGNTKKAVELLAQKLEEKGCPKVTVFDLARDDMAKAVEDAFRYGKLVLATITYKDVYKRQVVALSSLSNNLNQTLASGERVLSLLEETPMVEEIPEDMHIKTVSENFSGAEAKNVTFAYENETILDDYSLKLEPGKITGIHGASGSGKSTLLKLLMRFWDVNQGRVSVDGEDVRKIPTRYLRDMESYVTQETHLFHDSIANNIAVGSPGASREAIIEAAKKASIHDFIMELPKGYDTEVGELGDNLSLSLIHICLSYGACDQCGDGSADLQFCGLWRYF